MKRTFLLLLSALLPLLASAYDAQIDGIYYNFSGDEATVTYRIAYSYNSYSGNVVIPESVTFNDKTYSVTSIGSNAFYYCSSLTSITIPNSVTSIGNYAFQGCSGLTSVTIPNSVTSIGDYAFYGCSGLTSITIPNSVTSIGNYAFYGCSGLTSVTIPNSVTNIGNASFSGCSGLTSITIPNSVTSIDDSAFYGCSGLTSITIPNSVTSIGRSAFSSCSGLTSITIPNSVTSIGYQAFYGCSGLTSITIPNSVTSIGNNAFYNCSGLTSVIINCPNVGSWFSGLTSIQEVALGETVTSIGYQAFYNCSGLTSITIPNSVTTIGNYAFAECSGLTSITIPNSVTSIGYQAFYGCSCLTSITIPNSVTSIGGDAFAGTAWYESLPDGVVYIGTIAYKYKGTIPQGVQISVTLKKGTTAIADDAFRNCSGLTSITIPDSVTSIGESAFTGCSGLTSVTIPNSVTSIGRSAFEGCSSLTSITIPNSVTSIGDYAFYGCSGLTSITFPKSVTSIGERAFRGCLLRNVFVKCLTPPITPDDTDAGRSSIFSPATCHHATLYVPTGCWDAYAFGAGWFWFNNIRETAVAEEEVSMQQAYTLMDASTFAYSVYDPVNDRIGTINSAGGINEDNPNHSWQVIEADGWHYLYNIGARKYVRREGNRLELTDTPEPIELADSDNGLILGGQTEKPCVLVSNERMSVAQSAIDVVTSIKNLNNSPMANGQPFFNLAGQRIKTPQHGINIIGNRKVLVK